MEYGPYSPQEVDRIATWLNAKSISFQILRDDKEAKVSLMNDGLNALRLADLRTGIYLAQIFYILIESMSEADRQEFEQLFSLPVESFSHPERFVVKPEDEVNLSTEAKQHEKLQRSWAWLLAAAMMISVIIMAYMNFRK